MRTVHAIVYNYPVVEDGDITTIKQILPNYGFYSDVKDAYSKIDSLNYGWALEQSENCGHLVEDFDSLYEEILDRFCKKFGTTPYDFVSINIHNWMEK